MWIPSESLKQNPKSSFDGRTWIGKANDHYYSRLYSPVFEGRVEYISFLIDGGKGSGKTSKMCSTYEYLLKTIVAEYDEKIIYEDNRPISDSVNLIAVRSVAQVQHHFNHKPYQIILIDDAQRYNRQVKEDVKNDFNELRHIYGEHSTEGVLILLWSFQDGFNLQKSLRKDVSGYIWTDTPLPDYDRHFVNRQTCGRGLTYLSRWSHQIKDKKDISYLSRAIVSTESWAGYLDLPLPTDNRFLPYHKLKNRHGIIFVDPDNDQLFEQEEKKGGSSPSFSFKSGELTFTEIAKIDLFDRMIEALTNYKQIIASQKIKTIKRLKHQHVEAFIKYLQGHGIDYIAPEFSRSTQCLTNSYKNGGWFAIVREELIGHITEWLLVQPGAPYENYQIIAGQGRVDLLGEKAIEVKCRARYDSPTEHLICTEMNKLLTTGEKPCELIIVTARKEDVQGRIYQVVKNNHFTQSSDHPPHALFTTPPSDAAEGERVTPPPSSRINGSSKAPPGARGGINDLGVVKRSRGKNKGGK